LTEVQLTGEPPGALISLTFAIRITDDWRLSITRAAGIGVAVGIIVGTSVGAGVGVEIGVGVGITVGIGGGTEVGVLVGKGV